MVATILAEATVIGTISKTAVTMIRAIHTILSTAIFKQSATINYLNLINAGTTTINMMTDITHETIRMKVILTILSMAIITTTTTTLTEEMVISKKNILPFFW